MSQKHETLSTPTQTRGSHWRAICLVGVLAFVAAMVFRSYSRGLTQPFDPMPDTNAEFIELEGVILELNEQLNDNLARSVLNLRLPDSRGRELFADDVTVLDLSGESAPNTKLEMPGLSWRKDHWKSAAKPHFVSQKALQLWRPLFRYIDYFEYAKFAVVEADFLDEQHNQIEMRVDFNGFARAADDRRLYAKAKLSLVWQAQQRSDNQKSWIITEWRLHTLDTQSVERPLFTEALVSAIPDADLRSRLQRSLHEEFILENYRALLDAGHDGLTEWQPPHPAFSVVSQDRHPGLAVVNIDGDEYDDLYVMSRWGKNVLLRNRGDGTFEDVAAKWGLDFDGFCSSAVFADFDNDGDCDLILGRTLKPSLYLVNEGGRFVDRSADLLDQPLPMLVSSVSAADYNGDGLLDVYLSTYAVDLQRDNEKDPDRMGDDWLLSEYLPDDEARKLLKLSDQNKHDRLLKNNGPPNLLLLNRGGGGFRVAPENEQVSAWRHTYQASWCDFDGDGDPDLYLANDFAVNSLFRNDGSDGFVDVSIETGTTDIGFGMGASWGDYDHDGQPDLYVSNMFSKAGRRITARISDLDDRFGRMAGGNSLFHNCGERFEKVSGLESPALQVEKSGWAWGGQFADFDQDGDLDIYSLSGYYTAPKQIAVARDL
jgi:hypothetical protein